MRKQTLPFNMGPSTEHIYTDSYISIWTLMCIHARLHCTTACKFGLPILVPEHMWTRLHFMRTCTLDPFWESALALRKEHLGPDGQ